MSTAWIFKCLVQYIYIQLYILYSIRDEIRILYNYKKIQDTFGDFHMSADVS